jgi:hypothetical protein
VSLVAVSAEHCPVGSATSAKLRRKGDVSLVAGDWVAHEDLAPPGVDDEDAPVSAPEKGAVEGVGLGATAVVNPHGEAPARYAVRSVEDGGKGDPSTVLLEEPEEGRLPVVGAEADEEFGVGGKATPPLADEGDAREGGGLRREAEEDLPEDVTAVRRDAGVCDHRR